MPIWQSLYSINRSTVLISETSVKAVSTDHLQVRWWSETIWNTKSVKRVWEISEHRIRQVCGGSENVSITIILFPSPIPIPPFSTSCQKTIKLLPLHFIADLTDTVNHSGTESEFYRPPLCSRIYIITIFRIYKMYRLQYHRVNSCLINHVFLIRAFP